MLKPQIQVSNLINKIVHSLLTSLRGIDQLQAKGGMREEILNDNLYFYLMEIYFGKLISEVNSEIHNHLYDILVAQDKEYSGEEVESSSLDLISTFTNKYKSLLVTKYYE